MELGLALMAEWRELIVSLAEPWREDAGQRDLVYRCWRWEMLGARGEA